MEENKKVVIVENLKTFKTQLESKTVYLTQSEYNQLVQNGQVDLTIEYNIYEDDN